MVLLSGWRNALRGTVLLLGALFTNEGPNHVSQPWGGGKLLEEGLKGSALGRTEGSKGLSDLVLKLPCPHHSLYPQKDVC